MTQPATHPDIFLDKVLAIASEILEATARPEDNFFELGGDSVKAIDFCEQAEEQLDLLIDLELVWEAANFSSLAARLAESVTN